MHIEEGESHLLIKELRNYPEKCIMYLKMSVAQFDALLAILEPHKKMTRNFREPIEREQRLAVCLRYGHTHTVLKQTFNTTPLFWVL